jgi:hypothetical protein
MMKRRCADALAIVGTALVGLTSWRCRRVRGARVVRAVEGEEAVAGDGGVGRDSESRPPSKYARASAGALGDVRGHGGYFPGYLSETAFYPSIDLALSIQVNTSTISRHLNPRALRATLDACARAIAAEARRDDD